MKKILSLFIFVLCVALNANAQSSGSLGNSLSWVVEDGVLTISGAGEMPDYTSGSETPWYPSLDNITSIVIAEGVTSIGDYAFDHLDEVVSVEIPASVVSLGYYAFNYCSSLSEIFWYGTQKFSLGKTYYNFKSHIFPNTPSVITVYYKDGAVVSQWTATKFTKVLFDETGDIRWTLNAGKLIVTGKGDTQFAYVEAWDERRAEITTVELSGVAATVKDDKYVLSVDGKTLYFSVYTENVVIPDGITTIGEKAFYNLPVQTLTVSSKVQKIEDYAFFGGYSLTKVNAYPTAAPVLVGEDVFDEAAKDLAILYVEVEGADYSSWAGYFMQLSVPEAKEGTFATGGTWNFSGLKLTIEGDAVPNCYAGATPWQNWLSSATEIVVGDGVTSIGENAFNGAVARKVFISSAVETVNDKAFAAAPQGVVFTFGNNSKIVSGALPTSGVTKNLVIEEPKYIDKSGNPYYSADDLFVDNSNSYDQITLKRTFTKGTSGTIMLPFEYTNNSKTLKFYKLTAFDSQNTKITFEEQVILEANTPYLWKNNGSSNVVGITSEDVSLSSSAMKNPKTQTIEGWTMYGTYSEVKVTPDVVGFDTNLWIYSSKGKFEAYQDFCYVDPYSAYFKGKKFSEIFPDASDGKASINGVCEGRSLSVEFVDLDGTTSIENVTIDGDGSIDFSQQDGVYYDLSGRRVENPTAGIYIVNGKKVLVK